MKAKETPAAVSHEPSVCAAYETTAESGCKYSAMIDYQNKYLYLVVGYGSVEARPWADAILLTPCDTVTECTAYRVGLREEADLEALSRVPSALKARQKRNTPVVFSIDRSPDQFHVFTYLCHRRA